MTSSQGRPAVVVFGSANADLVVTVPRRPGAGETVLGGDLVVSPGGKGANQAVAAARLGAPVAFVGCVGDDTYGRLLKTSIAASAVDTTFLRVLPGPTGTALVLVTPDGDNSIVVSPAANGRVGTDDVTAAHPWLAGARVLVLQREIDPDVSAAAAAVTAAGGGRVLLSLAPSGPIPPALLRLADPLLVNEQEARDLVAAAGAPADGAPAGSAADARPADARPMDAAELARAVLATGARSAVVTLGAAGAVAAGPAGLVTVAAPEVQAVDTTGAGDALAGALAHRLAAGDDLPEALRFAVRVATISVTRAGAQPSFPTAAETTP